MRPISSRELISPITKLAGHGQKSFLAMAYMAEVRISEILVKPTTLKTTARELAEKARRIKLALVAVDHIMQEMVPVQFEGRRAIALLTRYRNIRENVMDWPTLITGFSRDLETTAHLFELADHSG